MKKTFTIALVLAALVGFGLAWRQSVLAQETASPTECPAGPRAEGRGFGREQMLANKAEILGLGVDELKARLEEGKSFLEIAEEQGITQEQLHEQMKEKNQERWQERGLSGEEINERLNQMDERFAQCPCALGLRFGFRQDR